MWVCVCAYSHVHTHDTVNLWRSEDNLQELILSFYHVRPEDQIKVIHQTWQQEPLLAESSHQPYIIWLMKTILILLLSFYLYQFM